MKKPTDPITFDPITSFTGHPSTGNRLKLGATTGCWSKGLGHRPRCEVLRCAKIFGALAFSKTGSHAVYSHEDVSRQWSWSYIIYSDHYDTMIVAIPACVCKIFVWHSKSLKQAFFNSAMTEPSAGRNSKRSVTAFFLVDDVIGLKGKGLQRFLQDRNYLPSWDSQHIPSPAATFWVVSIFRLKPVYDGICFPRSLEGFHHILH